MDIKTASVEALKAAAYDQLANIEQAKVNLEAINRELVGRQQSEVPDKEDKKK